MILSTPGVFLPLLVVTVCTAIAFLAKLPTYFCCYSVTLSPSLYATAISICYCLTWALAFAQLMSYQLNFPARVAFFVLFLILLLSAIR